MYTWNCAYVTRNVIPVKGVTLRWYQSGSTFLGIRHFRDLCCIPRSRPCDHVVVVKHIDIFMFNVGSWNMVRIDMPVERLVRSQLVIHIGI